MEALFHRDSYLQDFEATVVSVKDGRYAVLDRTAFYPNSGGQPHDTGTLTRVSDNKVFRVVYAAKIGSVVSHEVEPAGILQGDRVRGELDWDRRYLLMRMHTAAHLLSRIIFEEAGAKTSGNQLGVERSRIDFTLENLDRDNILGWIEKANSLIKENLDVTISAMSRKQAQKDLEGPSKHLMADMDVLRSVEITGLDKQTCGGTHLKNLSEIGAIELVKVENKGKNNWRIYYTVT